MTASKTHVTHRASWGRAGRLSVGALAVGLALLSPLGGASRVQAQSVSGSPGAAPSAEVAALSAQAASLRTRLDRVADEIRALKKSPRSVPGDYRLRDRMAEGEALGRRLTETEARLRVARGETGGQAAPRGEGRSFAAPPEAAPGDGPVELAAKADLLVDQARALSRQAEALDRRAARVQQRDVLRERVRQFDRDPFVGLESTKRNLVLSTSRQLGDKGGAGTSTGTLIGTTPPPRGDLAVQGDPRTPQASAPPVGGAEVATDSGGGRATDGSKNAQPNPNFGGADAATGGALTSVSTQFRALLDPQTLAEVARLEKTGTPAARARALGAAAAGLRVRAQELETRARSYETRAQAK